MPKSIDKKSDNFCKALFHKIPVHIPSDKKLCNSCNAGLYNNNNIKKGTIVKFSKMELTKNGELFKGNSLIIKDVNNKNISIWILISDSLSCCEDWGNFMEFDKTIIGADVYDVSYEHNYKYKNIDAISVIITTNRGVGRLCVWCDHNGYYPHTVLTQLIDKSDKFEL